MKLGDLKRVNQLSVELHTLRSFFDDSKIQVSIVGLHFDHAVNVELAQLVKPLARNVITKRICAIETELRQLGVQVG